MIQNVPGAVTGRAIYPDLVSVMNIVHSDCLVVRADFFQSRAIGCFGGDSWSIILALSGFRRRRIIRLSLCRRSFSGDSASATEGWCLAGTEQLWCLSWTGCRLAFSSICHLVFAGRCHVILRRSRRISFTRARFFDSPKGVEYSILVSTTPGEKSERLCRA